MLQGISLCACIFVAFIRVGPAVASAGGNVGEYGENAVSIGAGVVAEAPLNTAGIDRVGIEVNRVQLSRRVCSEQSCSVTLGAEFEYTIMDFGTLATMSNGHLHRWQFPLTWRERGDVNSFLVRAVPAVSTSSNALRNPELIDRQSLQLDVLAVYRNHAPVSSGWLIGMGGDHRFGDYRLYPVIGYSWLMDEGWAVQLAFPDSFIRKSIGDTVSLMIFTEPRGNRWHVFSKDRIRESDLDYETIRAGVSLKAILDTRFRLQFAVERQMRRKFSLELDDASRLQPEAEPATAFMLTGEMIF